MATHTDVCDPDLSDLSSSNLDQGLGVEIDNVDGLRGCIGHGFDDHVVL